MLELTQHPDRQPQCMGAGFQIQAMGFTRRMQATAETHRVRVCRRYIQVRQMDTEQPWLT
ncbi:hypothetical protein RHOFW104T7_17665 [Rhodanobacter thiooxydans]|uniref:Uncharacterized protein n=1 Tax=Rhodanobacter thiooxydans TaxID=416169 RepID=A0A154QEF3_9GAMM|nr:hypothetical protein RHOFW104T7_17665 [Rhodanobacter thiooxydans]